MFGDILRSREVIKFILAKRNYLLSFIIVSSFTFVILYLLTLATVTNQSIGIFIMMNGLAYTISTLILFGVISLLFGIYAVLLVFSVKVHSKRMAKRSVFGAGGMIAGIFGAGCPMCGSAIFAMFGAPLALFFLPLKGLELRMLSLILLLLSVYLLSRSLIKCKIIE